MLSKEENAVLTQTDAGTPMGELFRRFWLPALLATELPAPDCPPVKLRLLGEDLVAFRDTSGRVGILDRYCPHRGSSLYWGRNEAAGLRCVYHGWKFDVAGSCVDMPNEPAESRFKEKISTLAYPAEERGGVVWVYMGPQGVASAAAGVGVDAGAGKPPLRLQADRRPPTTSRMSRADWTQPTFIPPRSRAAKIPARGLPCFPVRGGRLPSPLHCEAPTTAS